MVCSIFAFFCIWRTVCTICAVSRFNRLLKQSTEHSAAAVGKCVNCGYLTAPSGKCTGDLAPWVHHGYNKEKKSQTLFAKCFYGASVAFRLAMGHVALELQLKCEKPLTTYKQQTGTHASANHLTATKSQTLTLTSRCKCVIFNTDHLVSFFSLLSLIQCMVFQKWYTSIIQSVSKGGGGVSLLSLN